MNNNIKRQIISELNRVSGLLECADFPQTITTGLYRTHESNTHIITIGFNIDLDSWYMFGYFYNPNRHTYYDDYCTIPANSNHDRIVFPFSIEYVIAHAILLNAIYKSRRN